MIEVGNEIYVLVLGALNLSKKKKLHLMFKGLQFWCSIAPSFFGAASKQSLKLHLQKSESKNQSAVTQYINAFALGLI